MVYKFYTFRGTAEFVYSNKMQPNADFKKIMKENKYVFYKRIYNLNDIIDEVGTSDVTYALSLDDGMKKLINISILINAL